MAWQAPLRVPVEGPRVEGGPSRSRRYHRRPSRRSARARPLLPRRAARRRCATPDAARRTAALLAGVKRDEKCCGSLGELMESAIRRDGSSTTVELHLDRYHAGRLDLELTIGRPTGKARVTGVRAISATSSASR